MAGINQPATGGNTKTTSPMTGLCNNDRIAVIFGRTDVSCVQPAIPGSLAFALVASYRYQDRAEAPSQIERLRRPSIERVDGAVPSPEHGSWQNRQHSEVVP
jgi:hypothetical protein